MSLARRFLRCLPLASALAVPLAACNIPYYEKGAFQRNACGAADECGADSICAPADEEPLCSASKADLPGVIFEIRPSAVAEFGAGISYLIDPSAEVVLQSGLAGPVAWNPSLPPLVSISPGQVTCLLDGSSVPAKVEFTRVSAFVGLPEAVVNAHPEMGEGSSFSFHIDVPPGLYNIYVQPESTPDAPILCGGAPVPPIFIPGKELAVNSTFHLEVNKPRNLIGTMQAPDTMSLDQWTLRVIEKASGRLISDVQTITQEDKLVPAGINLHYYFADGVAPVLLLAPPEGVVAPSVYWDLAAIDLDADNKVDLKLSALAVTPREVEGHILDANASPVIADVTLQSTSLSTEAFKNAAYMITTSTDADGLFKAQVPPGTYRVIAKPVVDKSLATSEATWVIPDDVTSCFCGQVVSLPPKITLEAEVLTPTQGSLLEASVVASPSLPPPISYLDRQLGRAPSLPREATGFVDEGHLSMGVDPGAFDFSVRPPAGSRYPWLVRSKLTVQPGAAQAYSSVGTLKVAHPVVVSGVVTDPFGASVPGASIRAWLPVKDEDGIARTVIQIGEAATDESGHYMILLPPSISE